MPLPVPLPEGRLWLVDGFNAIHTVLLGGQSRTEWWTEPVRRSLLERVALLDVPDAEVWVVFDGSRPADPEQSAEQAADSDALGPEIHVVFAPSADDWLVARARRAAEGDKPGVVTADRKVAGRCRHAGAAVVTPREFLAHCPRDDQQTP